jgi:hypothetical protein
MPKQTELEPLFPPLPEDLSALSDEELANLLQEHEVAADLIDKEDEEFTSGLTADEILEAYEAGVEQIEKIGEEQKLRVAAQEEYAARKAALAERRKAKEAAEAEGEGDEGEGDDEGEEAEVTAAAEGEELSDEEEDEVTAEAEKVEEEKEEPKEVAASARRVVRRPPPASVERRKAVEASGAPLVAAAGLQEVRGGTVMDRKSLAHAMKITATRRGKPSKSSSGVEERILVAAAQFPFPEDRQLVPGDYEANADKIQAVIPDYIPGLNGRFGVANPQALVASGGLCAPLEPIYRMPNFASQARPVRDALVSFRADRGGVNVPTATYIADITTAITVIEESEDALGGTFATKSCQDMSCPAYTETAVTIVSHCREYGNLNAMAWPEKIAHENDLTMAAHARTAETYLLDRIKAQSLAVTYAGNGATLNAFAQVANAILKAAASIRYNLRMAPGARFRAIAPVWLGDLLAADNAYWEDNGQQAQAALIAALERYGISLSFTLDSTTGGPGFSAEVAGGAIDGFPTTVEIAVYPEGAFIHVDSGSLELGLVRDSTLNSTNDFQIFGETFENVARLAPLQATRWITATLCPNGVFPALGTAVTC